MSALSMPQETWADLAVYRFGRFGIVGKLMPGDDWYRWAAELCAIPAIAQQGPPGPNSFDDFAAWSTAFDRTVTIGD